MYSPSPNLNAQRGTARAKLRRAGAMLGLTLLYVTFLLIGCGGKPQPCGGSCQEGYSCVADQCIKDVTCEDKQTKCNNTCVDTKINTEHCGKCGNKCKDGEACAEGACKEAKKCDEGQTACGEDCVDLQADNNNCGTCGTACKDTEKCTAGKCEKGPECEDNKTSCSGTCVDTDTDKDNCGACDNKCTAEESCTSGACKCNDNKTKCGDACVDTDTDKAHCGACDNACKDKESCEAGACKLVCDSGKKACNGNCVDTDTDKDNCGACDNKCGDGLVCKAGSCECPDGQKRCGGKCVDTSKDPKNCGQCGLACKDLEVCSTGQCKSTCDAGKTGCNGSCVDFQSDDDNCGACGNACGTGKSCCAGKCVNFQNDNGNCGKCGNVCSANGICCSGACVDAQADDNNCGNCGVKCSSTRSCTAGLCACKDTCNNQCVDLQNDNNNCGTCGTTCKSNEVCTLGKCEVPCPTGESKCNAPGGAPRTCHNLQKDPNHCGACGTTCGSTEACSAGTCTSSCPSGQKVCSRTCVDTQSDDDNCGTCGTKCSDGKSCQSGTCTCTNTKEICDNGKDDDCNGTIDDGCSLVASYGDQTGTLNIEHLTYDANGNIYVVGNFDDKLPLTTPPRTEPAAQINSQMFVAKMDKDGKLLWANAPSGGQINFPKGIAVDPLGNVIIAGEYITAIELTNTIKSVGYSGTDIYVAALSAAGKWKWVSTMGNTNARRASSITGVVVNSKGESFITGSLSHAPAASSNPGSIKFSNGTINLGPKNLYARHYVAKLNATGTWQWLKYNNTAWTYGSSIAIDDQDRMYIAGTFGGNGAANDSVNFGTHKISVITSSKRDLFMAQMDRNGNWKWARSFGSNENSDYLYRLYTSKAGVLVHGRCQTTCEHKGKKYNSGNFYATFSPAGTLKWMVPRQGFQTVGIDDAGVAYSVDENKRELYTYNQTTGKSTTITGKIPQFAILSSKNFFVSGTGQIYAYGSFKGTFTYDGQTLNSPSKWIGFIIRFK